MRFPIARVYAQVEAADLMVQQAAHRFDAGKPCSACSATAIRVAEAGAPITAMA